MKTRISIPAGVAVFAVLALAGLMGVFAFNAAAPAEAQANAGKAELMTLTVKNGNQDLLEPDDFMSDKTFYDIPVADDLDSVDVDAEAKYNGTVDLPGTGGEVSLKSGHNDMAVVVKSADGNASEVYFIRLTVRGANDLKTLEVEWDGETTTAAAVSDNAKTVPLTPDFTHGTRSYTATVPNAAGRVLVKAEAAKEGATSVSSGTKPDDGPTTDPDDDPDVLLAGDGIGTMVDGTAQAILTDAAGDYTIIITVDSDSGTKYTIRVKKEEVSKNLDLDTLKVSFGTPSFPVSVTNPSPLIYRAAVPSSVTTINLEAKLAVEGAVRTATGTNADDATITPTGAFSATSDTVGIPTLTTGVNRVNIEVTRDRNDDGDTFDAGESRTYTLYITKEKARDYDLGSLTIGSITPGADSVTWDSPFRSSHITYNVTGPSSITAFTVAAAAADTTNGEVEITAASSTGTPYALDTTTTVGEGAFTSLAKGRYEIKVKVTDSRDDKTGNRVYEIRVNLTDADTSTDLDSLAVTTKDGRTVMLAPRFQPETTLYTATVEGSADEVTVMAEAANARATVTGTILPAGETSTTALSFDDDEAKAGDLAEGVNEITITVTVGSDTNTYTVSIEKLAKSKDATLRNLMVRGATGGLDPAFESGTFGYTAMVAPTVSSVDVIAEKSHLHAKVESPGTVNLDPGRTQIIVVVTAENQEKQGYLVWVTKGTPSDDASLKSLTVSVGDGEELTLARDRDIFFGSVRHSVETVTVTAVAADGAMITAGNGSHDLSGMRTSIPVTVTAQDGTTTKEYTVVITKLAASSNAYLSALSIMNGEDMVALDPAFAADTTSYTAMVDNSVDFVDLTATTAHMGATLSGDGMQSLDEGANTITVTVTAEDDSTMDYTITVTRAYTEVTRQQVLDAIRAYINGDADALSREDLLALIRRYISG